MTLPPLGDLLAGMRVVSLPLRVRFRGVEHREAALVEGPAGWGEFAPFLEYGAAESSRWLAAAVEAAWEGFPEPVRSEVPVNATLPAVAPDQVAAVLARYDGCRTVKVKVAERGQSLADDLDRVAAVRDLVGPDVRIRVDANGGWDVDQALAALGALAAYGLEYAEQPCPTVEELAELRRRLARSHLDVPVAADESIRKAEDPLRVAREGAADLVVVKVAPLGGVRRALEIVGGVRAARGRLLGARHVGGDRGGGGARCSAAVARPRLRSGDGRAAGRRRGPAGAGAGGGVDRRGAGPGRRDPARRRGGPAGPGRLVARAGGRRPRRARWSPVTA